MGFSFRSETTLGLLLCAAMGLLGAAEDRIVAHFQAIAIQPVQALQHFGYVLGLAFRFRRPREIGEGADQPAQSVHFLANDGLAFDQHRGMGLILTFEGDAEAVRKLNEGDSVSGLR